MYVGMCVCMHNKNTYENAPDNYRLAIITLPVRSEWEVSNTLSNECV